MAVLRIQGFGGAIPVKGDRAIGDSFATEAVNTWLYGGELRGIRPRVAMQPVNNTTRKVFRIPRGTAGGDPAFPGLVPPPSYLGDSVWLQFTDMDTDIVRGPLVNDSHKRWYFCSPSTGLQFNTYARLINGDPVYKAGVIAPVAGVGLVAAGGSGTPVTRAYLITYENVYGEESGPSPPVTGASYPDATWTVTFPAPPTIPADYAPMSKINVYRTITSASGVATYFKVATVPWGTGSFADVGTTYTDAWLANQLQIDTVNYSLPPVGLQGIIAMPNGFLIGWVGSDVYCSEPYQPHAWPVEYITSTEYPVVGMGVLGTTCVVCTQGFPATLTGVKPVTISFTKATTNEPCLSRGSIVSTPSGVYYASQNGLISVSPAGINNITRELITREEWIRNYTPQYMRGVRYQNGYLALRTIPNSVQRAPFFLDPTTIEVALTEFTDFDTVRNLHNDVWSGEVFIIDEDAPNRMVIAGTRRPTH